MSVTSTHGPRFVYCLAASSRNEVLEEYTPTGWLAHTYDELGNRVSTTISGERTIDWLHYGSGHVHQIRFDGAAVADIERDDLHREVLRTQGKLTSRFDYDSVGRRAQHTARQGASHDALLAKQWRYDAAGEVIQKGDQRYGVVSYRYDPTGRIEQATGPGLPSEVFRWDAAANLVSSDHPGGYVEHNRLRMFEDKRFEYDAYGRLSRKLSGRGVMKEQTFEYDDWHQLKTVVTKAPGRISTTHFEYDAFGRRIRKLNGGYASTDFLWDGMRLVEETYHDRRGKEALTYLYESDSYVPLARIDNARPAANDGEGQGKVYYFHNDVSGLPEELTDADGELVWQARYKVWGNSVQEEWIRRAPPLPPPEWGKLQPAPPPLPPVPRPQNLRFQGQYLDRETGLHYNAFRYYDPDIGRFINQDPIGLAGGSNLYAYAPNPVTWIDPWGWCSVKLSKNMEEAGTTRPANSAAHHVVGDTASKAGPARRILAKHGIDVDSAENGVFLPNRNNSDGMPGILHNGRHPDAYFDSVNQLIARADALGGKQAVLDEIKNIGQTLSTAARDADWRTVIGD